MKETAALKILKNIIKTSKDTILDTLAKTITVTQTDWNHALKTMIATVHLSDPNISNKMKKSKLEKY